MKVALEGFYLWLDESSQRTVVKYKHVLMKLVPQLMNCLKKDTIRFSRAEFPSVLLTFLLNTLFISEIPMHGPLSAFWMSYIDMIELLLHMIRASRKGIGNSISPVSARCSHGAFPPILSTMRDTWQLIIAICLPDEHSEVQEFMRNGGFSVQLSNDNTFERIPIDQTLEETVNKDMEPYKGTT